MHRFWKLGCAVALVLLASVSAAWYLGNRSAPRTRELAAAPEASPSSRPPLETESRPQREKARLRFPRVENVAFPPGDRKVSRAIADLKRIGLWRPLTKRLYVVVTGSRPGAHRVPADGHLADVYLTGHVDEHGSGARCDVMFYPRAMRSDLDRRRQYYALGYIDQIPPTLRGLWASVLAHELAHCLGAGRGETIATRWEDKALRLLRN